MTRTAFALVVGLLISNSSWAQGSGSALDEEMEDVKKALIELKRDLLILEEDLLFPPSSQVSVFYFGTRNVKTTIIRYPVHFLPT